MPTTRRRTTSRRPVLVLLLAALVGYLLAQWFAAHTPIAWDPSIYRDRVADWSTTNLPYLQAEFEHFPGVIPPMWVAWALTVGRPIAFYFLVWVGISAGSLAATVVVLDRAGEHLGIPAAGSRFAAMTVVAVPFLVFRTEPWILAFTSLAILGLVSGARWGVPATLWAVATKGWPGLLAWVTWRRRRVGTTTVIVVWTGLLAGLLLASPGFVSGRSFEGIHSESAVGAFLGLWRALAGRPVGSIGAAGAWYLPAPQTTVLVNLAVGGVLGALVLWRRRADDLAASLETVGLLVVALLLASPLFSTQYIAWPLPFLVFSPKRSVRVTTAWSVGLSTLAILTWNHAEAHPLPWFGLVSVRNLLLVAVVALALAAPGAASKRSSSPRTQPMVTPNG